MPPSECRIIIMRPSRAVVHFLSFALPGGGCTRQCPIAEPRSFLSLREAQEGPRAAVRVRVGIRLWKEATQRDGETAAVSCWYYLVIKDDIFMKFYVGWMDRPKKLQYVLYNQRVVSTGPYHEVLFSVLRFDMNAFSRRQALSNRTSALMEMSYVQGSSR